MPPAAGDQPVRDRGREMTLGCGDAGSGYFGKCRGGIRSGEIRHRRRQIGKGIPIERFGRGALEIPMAERLFHNRAIGVPGPGYGTIQIHHPGPARPDQIIERRVARPGIKGQKRPGIFGPGLVQIRPGHIPDTANIDHRNPAREPARAQRMKMEERRKGRALAARRHIRAAKIPDHRRLPECRQFRAISDLAGAASGGIMGQGLAVKSDQIRHIRDPRPEPWPMPFQDCRLRLWAWIPAAGRAQQRLHLRRIGESGGCAKTDDIRAIGLHDRRIHPIHGCARHQSQSGNHGGQALSFAVDPGIQPQEAQYQRIRPMTMNAKSEFLNIMQARGFLQDCTDMDGLDTALTEGIVPGYIGFDCTAPSLHIGSLIQIMMLRWLQKCGGKPIALMGGGTTRIGDPSGRDESRQLLTSEKIAENMAGIRAVFDRYLTFGSGPSDALMANNADWLDQLNYVEFLRDYGRHFTINRMLTFDSVRLRLDREQPLTFLEFNYMLLQAYDFMELNKRLGCRLQMGGSDQWGNIVNGIDLTRRINRAEVYGLTSPLLTKADGTKMGKSVGGAIWLNAAMLSSYEFWQFWRNTLDADVGRFLKLYTELPVAECDRLGALEGAEINAAKIILANEVTTLAHGRAAADAAAETARDVFEKGGTGDDLPTISVPLADISVVQLFVKTGLSGSGKEAKRLIADGGAKLNDKPVTDAGRIVTATEISAGLKLSAGKKRHALIRPE